MEGRGLAEVPTLPCAVNVRARADCCTRGLVRPSILLALLVSLTAACDRDHLPERCYTSADCGSAQVCVRFPSSAQACVDRCDSAAGTLCEGGEVCAALSSEDAQVDVCLPGGDLALGATCTASHACVEGALCVVRSPSSMATCARACDVGGAAVCDADETCVAIDAAASATRGTCVTP